MFKGKKKHYVTKSKEYIQGETKQNKTKQNKQTNKQKKQASKQSVCPFLFLEYSRTLSSSQESRHLSSLWGAQTSYQTA